MRKHTCHLDLRQGSLYVTIGQKNWVQKLIDNRKKKLLDSHEKKLLDSHEEKFLDKQNSSNQPNQSQNQSVIDQGNLITRKTCLLLKAKHSGLERSRRHLLTKNSVLQIDQGNLITNTKCLLIKAKHPGLERSRRNLLTKNSVLQIDQGNLISRLA